MGIPLALINEAIKIKEKKIKWKDLDNKVKQAKENKYLKRCCLKENGAPKDTQEVLAKKIDVWDALATARKEQNDLYLEFLPPWTSVEEHIKKLLKIIQDV